MTDKNPHWDDLRYHRMVQVVIRDRFLDVAFEDGDQVALPAERLLPPNSGRPDWSGLTFDPYEIQVPTSTGTVETPWSTVRLLTDPEYAAFVAASAHDYAIRMGQRIRTLRKARGLTGKELASRAGITPNSLSRIELGRHDVTLTTLGSLLAAMGYTYADLTEPAPVPSSAMIGGVPST